MIFRWIRSWPRKYFAADGREVRGGDGEGHPSLKDLNDAEASRSATPCYCSPGRHLAIYLFYVLQSVQAARPIDLWLPWTSRFSHPPTEKYCRTARLTEYKGEVAEHMHGICIANKCLKSALYRSWHKIQIQIQTSYLFLVINTNTPYTWIKHPVILIWTINRVR